MPDFLKKYNPLIHIMAEVVVFAAVSVFFYFRMTKLDVAVRELIKKINEQQIIIQRHEELLNKIMNEGVHFHPRPQPAQAHIHTHAQPQVVAHNNTPPQPRAPQQQPIPDELESESVLDADLISELDELEDNRSSIHEISSPKQSPNPSS